MIINKKTLIKLIENSKNPTLFKQYSKIFPKYKVVEEKWENIRYNLLITNNKELENKNKPVSREYRIYKFNSEIMRYMTEDIQ